MALILNIDTAVQTASVCLAAADEVIGSAVNPSQQDSAGWLHVATQNLLQQSGKHLQQVEAVAVSAGPGSYTGLRVGMAAAKGLCYALSVPLITIPTLQMMAASVQARAGVLLCPMIDARRMEVFTALYDSELNEVMQATNLILQEGCFDEWLQTNAVIFFGNGSAKAASLLAHPRAQLLSVTATAVDMVKLAARRFEQHEFSDLAYTEPFYGKEFYSPVSKKNH